MTHLVPPDAEERYVSIDQGRVRVLVGGQPGTPALPLVLVHGGGTDNAGISWFRSFTELGADRALIALDLPGFGGTHGIAALPARHRPLGSVGGPQVIHRAGAALPGGSRPTRTDRDRLNSACRPRPGVR